jgi:hypothetical protein
VFLIISWRGLLSKIAIIFWQAGERAHLYYREININFVTLLIEQLDGIVGGRNLIMR